MCFWLSLAGKQRQHLIIALKEGIDLVADELVMNGRLKTLVTAPIHQAAADGSSFEELLGG